MPMFKKYGVRRSYKKRKFYRKNKRGYSKYTAAYAVRKAEVKKHDLNQVGIVVTDNVAYYAMLHGIARGAGSTERVGNKIANKYLDVRGQVVRNAAGPNSQSLRIVVVVDTQQIADDLILTWAEVFGTDSNSHVNVETAGRFKILRDVTYTVSASADTMKPFHMYIPLRGMTTRFNGPNAADIESRGIFLIALADTESGANGPTLIFRSRMGFTDL